MVVATPSIGSTTFGGQRKGRHLESQAPRPSQVKSVWAGDVWTWTPQLAAMGERIIVTPVALRNMALMTCTKPYTFAPLAPNLYGTGCVGTYWPQQHFLSKRERRGRFDHLEAFQGPSTGHNRCRSMTRGTGHDTLSDVDCETGWTSTTKPTCPSGSNRVDKS